jgi:ubiquinone/menaquinone biosynthesis C-methylase UbiE
LEKPVRHDWRSYDEIAERYDRVWSARFETVARHIWARVPVNAFDRVLDIGTGTGVVPRIRLQIAGPAGLIVGCDRSAAMLERARGQAAGLHVLVADATTLPLRDESFDVATASFVLSHIRDHRGALAEMLRVLKPGGIVAVTNWAPASDPYSAAWSECLAGAISKSQIEWARAEVTPWEEHFSRQGALEKALTDAGFSQADPVAVDVESDFTVEQFLEDRELSSSGRLGRHLLGADAWARFCAGVSEVFHNRFGSSLRYCRDALIATATKP